MCRTMLSHLLLLLCLHGGSSLLRRGLLHRLDVLLGLSLGLSLGLPARTERGGVGDGEGGRRRTGQRGVNNEETMPGGQPAAGAVCWGPAGMPPGRWDATWPLHLAHPALSSVRCAALCTAPARQLSGSRRACLTAKACRLALAACCHSCTRVAAQLHLCGTPAAPCWHQWADHVQLLSPAACPSA